MKKSETHSAQKECRELLIFLLVTYGIPYLMIIPMAILTYMGKKIDFFVSAQMFAPQPVCCSPNFSVIKTSVVCQKISSLVI